MCQHEMLLPEVQLGLNLIIEGCLQIIIERKKKNRKEKKKRKEKRKKERKKRRSYFIRGGVISYVIVTSFFCHRLMLTPRGSHCNGGS